jgi:hypothetical protein
VTLSGVIYLWMKYLLPPPEGFSILRHPLQPLVLKLHILTAPLLLFAIGAIAIRHIWRHVAAKTRHARRSGWSAAFTILPMVFTGYLLQAITSDSWLRGLAITHIATGVIYGGGLLIHQVMVRRERPAAQQVIARGDRRRRPRRRKIPPRMLK